MRKLFFIVLLSPFLFAQEVGVPIGATKVPVVAQSCTGTDKVSAVGADGAVTCSADEGGAGGGDNVTINSSAAADVNLKDSVQIAFSLDGVPTPDDVTALIVANSVGPASIDETAQFAFSHVSNTFVGVSFTGALIGLADTASALAANGGNCSGNNFALGVDAAGVAECAQPAFTNLSGAAITTQLPTSIKTQVQPVVLFDSTGLLDADDIPSVWRAPTAVTITEIWCETDAGTPSVNFQRDDGVAANVLSSNLTPTIGGATGTIDTNEDNFADGERLDFVMVGASTATRISCMVEYTVD